MGCLEGDKPSKEHIKRYRQFVDAVREPAVRQYVEESTCAFEAGAYNAAIIAGWCAVACYLRKLVEAIGYEVGRRYYKWNDEEEYTERQKRIVPGLERWDGRPLLVVCDRLRVFSKNLLADLHPFWEVRCQCAHPGGDFECSETAFNLMNGALWLLTRSINKERFQRESVVYECAEDRGFSLGPGQANRLIGRLCKNQYESVARWVLEKALSPERNVNIERLLALWEALKHRLSFESRQRIMGEKLAPLIEAYKVQEIYSRLLAIDEIIDVSIMAKLVFWEDIGDSYVIWDFFASRRFDLSERIKQQIRQFAPSPYRELIDEPIDLEEENL